MFKTTTEERSTGSMSPTRSGVGGQSGQKNSRSGRNKRTKSEIDK